MAGHSKWSKIKRQKAKVDTQKGAAFAKFAREIMIAAREGGGEPEGNFRLRTAIDRAKDAGLPNDNINRAIEKATGTGDNDNLEQINYEGYGPGGVAVFVEALTDNRNRTAGDIRSYFNKYSGNLGETGCVGWMFKQEGQVCVLKSLVDKDNLLDAAINAGAEDFQEDDEEYFKIITMPENLQSVSEGLESSGYKLESAEITRTPKNVINIEDKETAKTLLRLLDNIENHPDVQQAYANFEMDDGLLESLD